MKLSILTLACIVLPATASIPVASLRAAPRVDADIAIESGFNATDLPAWHDLLTSVGVDNLRLGGGANGTKRLAIEPNTAAGGTSYRVFGIISTRGELLLPGGRYGRSDRTALAKFFSDVKTSGGPRKAGEKPPPFGLPPDVLEAVSRDLANPVDFTTTGVAPAKVLFEMGKRLASPFVADPAIARKLGQAEKVPGELKGLACGTAAAAILRREGLSIMPRLKPDGRPEYYVSTAGANQDVWPVGWPPERAVPEMAPELFTLRNVEIDDISAAQLFQVVTDRVKLPMLFDEQALLVKNVDPSKVKIKIPLAKLGYSAVLDRAMFQAGLKHEVRVDDAGKPFFWVTTR
ncbi:MAG: hypothetical protein C0483_21525 [Pirellula sp.]|nr:hypothetical protein [Pirellula sp.]